MSPRVTAMKGNGPCMTAAVLSTAGERCPCPLFALPLGELDLAIAEAVGPKMARTSTV